MSEQGREILAELFLGERADLFGPRNIVMVPAPYAPSEGTTVMISNNFKYHSPDEEAGRLNDATSQGQRYNAIRGLAGAYARFLFNTCPGSRELSLALTNLEQAVFWANAAIARNEG